MEYTGHASMCLTATPLIAFITGSCWIFIAFVKDLENDLPKLNGDEKPIEKQSLQYQLEIKQIFCDIAQRFSDGKQLN